MYLKAKETGEYQYKVEVIGTLKFELAEETGMEQPTASQVIMTNTAFMLQQQLEEVELEKENLGKQLETMLSLHKKLRIKYEALKEENKKLKGMVSK